jgi:predicted RNase H-like nuclease (RuvC/YqgF family)
MARYTLTMTVEAAQPASVEKKLKQAFGEDIPVHTVEKVKTAESRADRLSEASGNLESAIEDAKTIVEELRDEMQNWYDSIPENLQQGDKANEVQESIDALENVSSELDNLDASNCGFDDVNFPSMY